MDKQEKKTNLIWYIQYPPIDMKVSKTISQLKLIYLSKLNGVGVWSYKEKEDN